MSINRCFRSRRAHSPYNPGMLGSRLPPVTRVVCPHDGKVWRRETTNKVDILYTRTEADGFSEETLFLLTADKAAATDAAMIAWAGAYN